MRKSKGIKGLILAAIAVLVLVIAGVAARSFTGTGNKYETSFYPGTTLNGIDISGLTAEKAREKISGMCDDYSLSVTLKDGKVTLSAADMKLAMSGEVDLQSMKDAQNQVPFKETAQEALALEAENLFSCDEEAIRTALSADPAFDLEAPDALPTPSKLAYDADASKFVLEEGKAGKASDIDAVTKAAFEAAEHMQSELDARDMALRALNADSEKGREILKKANACLDLNISYTFSDDETEKIDKKFISEIVFLSDKGELQFNTDRVQELVNKYVKDHNNGERILDFETTNRGVIELSVPADGETIDGTALYEDILNCLEKQEGGERDVPYAQTDGDISSDFGGDYVEIDLDNQVLYFYKGGELQLTSDIVSGDVYYTHMTPNGVFQVFDMATNVKLKGPGYISPVTYWMPFTGSIGMHDATWRWEFGGEIYLNDGSHGCINMPYDNAEYVFNNIYIGYYVICYGGVQYVPGQTIEPYKPIPDEDEETKKKETKEKETEEDEEKDTKATKATETKKATEATKATETKKATEATKATETKKATESTKATEKPTEKPTSAPTEKPTEPPAPPTEPATEPPAPPTEPPAPPTEAPTEPPAPPTEPPAEGAE